MTQVLQKDPIQIFYPNGGTSASQMYVWDSGLNEPVLWDGAVTFSGTIAVGAVDQGAAGVSPWLVTGTVTVGNAAGASAVNIQDGGNSITVDGSVTVTQATGTNLHAVIDSGTVNVGTVTTLPAITGTVSVSNFPATQPVSGTVNSDGLVSINGPAYSSEIAEPISLDQFGNTRVLTTSDAAVSVWDIREDDPWNFNKTTLGFDLANEVTIDNAWES